jgi:hypothetical protein
MASKKRPLISLLKLWRRLNNGILMPVTVSISIVNAFIKFVNQILTFILYIDNVSRTVLAGIGLAWPVGDRSMRDPRMAHLKSCAPRTVRLSTVYWIIVHVLDWFKHQHNLLINGLLTVKAGWGIYCFVVVRGGGDAGSGAPDGGPDPRPEKHPDFRIFQKWKLVR